MFSSKLSDSLDELIGSTAISKRLLHATDGDDDDVDDFIESCRRELSARYPLEGEDEVGSLGSDLDNLEVEPLENKDQGGDAEQQQSLEDYTHLAGKAQILFFPMHTNRMHWSLWGCKSSIMPCC